MNSKNFIVFFNQKEGTSPLVRLLNHVRGVAVIHQVENAGWEPFDKHNCGNMKLQDLIECLHIIYSTEPADMNKLNELYTKTATRPLASFEKQSAVGFKMRLYPPRNIFLGLPNVVRRVPIRFYIEIFRRRMFHLLREHDVHAFIAVRQDVLRWALSMYHGDGTAKKGHMQFRIAKGEIELRDLPKIYVDCDRLSELISEGVKKLHEKQLLINEMQVAGIPARPLLYEEFCFDPAAYLRRFFDSLDAPISNSAIAEALQHGTVFKKVHPADISTFVINHEEVLSRFENSYVAWTSSNSTEEFPNARPLK